MANYKLAIEFDSLEEMQDFTKLLYELETLQRKAISRKDKENLGYNLPYSIEAVDEPKNEVKESK